ncbi:hypothetical protein [Leptospira mtsangambouensis]|uniref:hypothetical protein n=1 Tax=Leptospira mtsangambouensis TaxID=2484912 RepID=UPI001EEA27EE|nr:hypothetical protein [Leptospira mtsangambouensis]MCG6142780.1 hypothetical protein [Leptospira mtsangambouensis]
MINFIIKSPQGETEIFAFAFIEYQQSESVKKLILHTAENSELKKFGKKILFMRVSNLQNGLYQRFRENIWYISDNYKIEGNSQLVIYSYSQHTSFWDWLEKRINPLAITIATLSSSIVTLIGINLNTYLQNKKIELQKKENVKIESIEDKNRELEITTKKQSKIK